MFLRKLSEGRQRFRRRHPHYWLDLLVERIRRENPANCDLNVTGRVWAILHCELLAAELVVPGINIVTNAGDVWYAQRAGGETVSNDFLHANAGLRLGNDDTAPTKSDTDVTAFLSGTAIARDSGYPKTDDDDARNESDADVNVLTWRYSYGTSDGNASGIIEGAIVDNRTTPTAALTHFLFAEAFSKTTSDSLTVFVNHELTGA